MRIYILFFACAYTLVNFASAASVSFPPINKCHAEDSKCIRKSAQDLVPTFAKGLPNLGIESMIPLYFKTMDASTPNLKLTTTDLKVFGMKDCVIKKIQRNVAKSKVNLKFECPTQMEGKYVMHGQILIIPIEGKGIIRSNIPKMIVNIDVDLGDTVKNGVKYWVIKAWKSSFELKERSTLEFTNLFNGNEIISRAATDLIRSSANEIILEVGGPMVTAIIGRVVENIRNFFSHVPASELTLDV